MQFPEEHKEVIPSSRQDVWYDQLRQQVNHAHVQQRIIDAAAWASGLCCELSFDTLRPTIQCCKGGGD